MLKFVAAIAVVLLSAKLAPAQDIPAISEGDLVPPDARPETPAAKPGAVGELVVDKEPNSPLPEFQPGKLEAGDRQFGPKHALSGSYYDVWKFKVDRGNQHALTANVDGYLFLLDENMKVLQSMQARPDVKGFSYLPPKIVFEAKKSGVMYAIVTIKAARTPQTYGIAVQLGDGSH